MLSRQPPFNLGLPFFTNAWKYSCSLEYENQMQTFFKSVLEEEQSKESSVKYSVKVKWNILFAFWKVG